MPKQPEKIEKIVQVLVAGGMIQRLEVESDEPEGSTVESYRIVMIPLNVETDDGRIFEQLDWRDPPLPMMATDKTSYGHEGAVLVGNFDNITTEEIDGVEWMVATPTWDTDEEAAEFRRMVDEGMLRGWSADVAIIDADFDVTYDEDGFIEDMLLIVHEGKILGGTIVPMPAFEGTKIEPEGIAASLEIPTQPPAELFSDPGLERLTPITVEGIHVFGHLAPWNECHTGIQDVCTVAPRSASDYALFLAGQIETDDGKKVSAGQITLAGGHAGRGMNWKAAAAHYDETRSAVADVTVGEDDFGIWFSGAIRPGVTEEQIRMLEASKLSGDWRSYKGSHELVAMLCVNSPGFPIARALVASGEQQGLILHGAVPEIYESLAHRLERAVDVIEQLAIKQEMSVLVSGLVLIPDH